jgi:hypothetical protein
MVGCGWQDCRDEHRENEGEGESVEWRTITINDFTFQWIIKPFYLKVGKASSPYLLQAVMSHLPEKETFFSVVQGVSPPSHQQSYQSPSPQR